MDWTNDASEVPRDEPSVDELALMSSVLRTIDELDYLEGGDVAGFKLSRYDTGGGINVRRADQYKGFNGGWFVDRAFHVRDDVRVDARYLIIDFVGPERGPYDALITPDGERFDVIGDVAKVLEARLDTEMLPNERKQVMVAVSLERLREPHSARDFLLGSGWVQEARLTVPRSDREALRFVRPKDVGRS